MSTFIAQTADRWRRPGRNGKPIGVSGRQGAAIFEDFYEGKDGFGYSRAERLAAWNVVEALVGAVETVLPEEQIAPFRAALVERMRRLDGAVFEGVNPVVRSNPVFHDALSESRARFADGRAVHLELGTWTSWPRERVEAQIAADRLGDLIRLDMNPAHPVDVAASVTALPFADESIDRIASNSLFEHVAYPHEILRESFRVLRPGGMLITTVPFHFVQHDCPRDYLRYTGEFFEDVCGDMGFAPVVVDTLSTSGLYYTLHQFAKAAFVNAEHPFRDAARLAHLTVVGLLASIQGLDDAFLAQGASFWHSTQMIAVKPGVYTPREETFDRSQPFVDRFLRYLVCPATGLPVVKEGGQLVAQDGSRRYDIGDGVPRMFVLHGLGSALGRRSSAQMATPTNRPPDPILRIVQRYFTDDQIDRHLTIDAGSVAAAGFTFRIDQVRGALELANAPSDFTVPEAIKDDPDRIVWEAVAALKVGVFRSRGQTVELARSGELYDEDYYTRRGGGGPYTGYPNRDDGSTEAAKFDVLAREIVDRFGPVRILDVGCATGVLVKALQDLGADAWGIDVSAWAVEHAICANIRQADARNLEMFSSGQFDVVVSQDFLEHVAMEELPVVLAELHRVTRTDGVGLHFVPFYPEFPDPIAIDAHLCTADKAWWDRAIAESGLFEVLQSAPDDGQWDYSEGVLSRYYWLRARNRSDVLRERRSGADHSADVERHERCDVRVDGTARYEEDGVEDLSHLVDRTMHPIRLAYLDDRANLYRPFLSPRTAAVVNRAIFGLSFSGSTDPSALSYLAMLCLTCQPSKVLELGTYYGFSTLVLADLLSANPRPGRIVTVEANAVSQDNAKRQIQEAGLTQAVDFVLGSSTDASTIEMVRQRGPYDLLYIDSSHDYQPTLAELDAYLLSARMVRPGGITVLHDITLERDDDKGVGTAVNEWVARHPDFRYLPLTAQGLWPNHCGLGIILSPS